jgi:transposase
MRYVGLDVHAETIAVAVAASDGSVRELGTIRHRPEAVRKLITKLGGPAQLRVCYEAGPTGYPLYWQLTALGVACDVIAPSLVPTKAGDRVKTDRKDAARLARCYRAGDLTAVWVPDAATEALRDLVRAREVTKQDQLRARHRVSKFLLRHGCQRPDGMRPWTRAHAQWLARQTFAGPTLQVVYEEYRAALALLTDRVVRLERAIGAALPTLAPAQYALVGALATLRGVRQITAATIVSELGTLRRFATRAAAHELCGAGAARTFEWEPRPPRGDYQDRECASAPGARRSRVGIPPPPHPCERRAARTATRTARHDHRHRDESPTAPLSALSAIPGARHAAARRGDADCA